MALYSAKEAKWYRRNVERREHRFFFNRIFFYSPSPPSPPLPLPPRSFSSLSVLSRPNSPSLFLCGKKKKKEKIDQPR